MTPNEKTAYQADCRSIVWDNRTKNSQVWKSQKSMQADSEKSPQYHGLCCREETHYGRKWSKITTLIDHFYSWVLAVEKSLYVCMSERIIDTGMWHEELKGDDQVTLDFTCLHNAVGRNFLFTCLEMFIYNTARQIREWFCIIAHKWHTHLVFVSTDSTSTVINGRMNKLCGNCGNCPNKTKFTIENGIWLKCSQGTQKGC